MSISWPMVGWGQLAGSDIWSFNGIVISVLFDRSFSSMRQDYHERMSQSWVWYECSVDRTSESSISAWVEGLGQWKMSIQWSVALHYRHTGGYLFLELVIVKLVKTKWTDRSCMNNSACRTNTELSWTRAWYNLALSLWLQIKLHGALPISHLYFNI